MGNMSRKQMELQVAAERVQQGISPDMCGQWVFVVGTIQQKDCVACFLNV